MYFQTRTLMTDKGGFLPESIITINKSLLFKKKNQYKNKKMVQTLLSS